MENDSPGGFSEQDLAWVFASALLFLFWALWNAIYENG
jgi:hypothetical protein